MKSIALAAAALSAGAIWFGIAAPSAAETPQRVPAPIVDETAAPGMNAETAVLAGGCFWGVQGVFQHVKGVTGAVSGYAGGPANLAFYDRVSMGNSGHAESVRISYDPRVISYGKLLRIYFSVAHDPTELNRQGPDTGTQYRSTIFPVNAEQARVGHAYIAQLDQARSFGRPLATTVEPGKSFYPAEAYHQDYLLRNPRQPYIVINDLPKVAALQRLFPEDYRAEPVRVGTVLARQP